MFQGPKYKVCPKTGKVYRTQPRYTWRRWLWPLTGLLATLWFLIRVIPKPSRATYPCQKMAFPIASSFVAYLIGIFTTAAIVKRARAHIKRAKYIVAAICLCIAVATAWFTIGVDVFRARLCIRAKRWSKQSDGRRQRNVSRPCRLGTRPKCNRLESITQHQHDRLLVG